MEVPTETRVIYENKPLDLLIEAIRASVRPFLTISGWLSLAVMVYEGRGSEIPEYYVAAVILFTGWWFKDRTTKHQKENNQTASAEKK